MAIKKFTDGTIAYAADINSLYALSLRQNVYSMIRQLQDRSITLDPYGGIYAEAFIDANGRLNTVDTPTTTAVFDTNKYKITGSISLIELVIPTGILSPTISSCFASCIFANYESGVTVQYMVISSGENSGWLNINEVCNFTAFTTEPTGITIKLTPKGTSPTPGFPAIYGFGLISEAF